MSPTDTLKHTAALVYTGTRSSRNGRVSPSGEDLGSRFTKDPVCGSRFRFWDLAQKTFDLEKAVARAAHSSSCVFTPHFRGVNTHDQADSPWRALAGARFVLVCGFLLWIAGAYTSLLSLGCEPGPLLADHRGQAPGRPLVHFQGPRCGVGSDPPARCGSRLRRAGLPRRRTRPGRRR